MNKKRNGSDALNKYCPMCKELKPRTMFAKDRSRYDGAQPRCRGCVAFVYRGRKDKHRAATKRWVKANPRLMLGYAAKWRDANREYLRARDAKFARENPDICCFKSAKRRAASEKATPRWANLTSIKEIYALARERTKQTGVKWVVDHIVPLQSARVCGLHVEHNLQLLPETENSKKHNKVWPEMP